MRPERQLESVMEVILPLKESLEGLAEAFQKMLPVLEREHQLIKASSLSELEELALEKAALGEEVERTSERLLKSSEELRGQYVQIVPGAVAKKGANLKDCVGWLKAIIHALGDQGLGVQVLGHLADKIEVTYELLTSLKMRAQPRLDLNTFLTKELLRQHRENIRLLQSVKAELNATYDSSGSSRQQNAKGILQIKA